MLETMDTEAFILSRNSSERVKEQIRDHVHSERSVGGDEALELGIRANRLDGFVKKLRWRLMRV